MVDLITFISLVIVVISGVGRDGDGEEMLWRDCVVSVWRE